LGGGNYLIIAVEQFDGDRFNYLGAVLLSGLVSMIKVFPSVKNLKPVAINPN
jgi:hypothetical protein